MASDTRRDGLESSIRNILQALTVDELAIVDELVERLFRERLDRDSAVALDARNKTAPFARLDPIDDHAAMINSAVMAGF
jgi:hypothetical protein